MIYLTLRLMTSLIQFSPKPMLALLVWFFEKLIFHTIGRWDIDYARRNVAQIYRLPAGSHFNEMFVRQCLHLQCATAVETLRATVDPKAIRLVGFEDLQERSKALLRANKGMIAITAHIGSWELAGSLTAKAGDVPMAVLAKPAKYPQLTKYLGWLRQRTGTTVLWTNRKTLLREMLATVHERGILGFVMDQKPLTSQGITCDFLGQRAEFVGGPAQLAAKTQCPVLATFVVREFAWNYRVISKIILPADHGMTDVEAITKLLVETLDNAVKSFPEQWTWNYKRWRFSHAQSFESQLGSHHAASRP